MSIEESWLTLVCAKDLDLSQFKPVRFELARKDARVNMRLPEPLLEAVKAPAKVRGIAY